MDPGESDMQTALRETQEEAGFNKEDLKIHPNKKIELKYEVRGKMKTVVYFVGEVVGDKEVVLSREHTEYKWLGIEKACMYAKYEDMQGALREVHEFVGSSGCFD